MGRMNTTITVEIDDEQIEEIFEEMGQKERLEWAWSILENEEDNAEIVERTLTSLEDERIVEIFKDLITSWGQQELEGIQAIFEHAMNKLNELKAQKEAA